MSKRVKFNPDAPPGREEARLAAAVERARERYRGDRTEANRLALDSPMEALAECRRFWRGIDVLLGGRKLIRIEE